ncbi:MAG: hypothetical protein GY898_02540 [Proteobacteria bacterium]|nr:hypothetical protein [Pseudomonadota bacterium]
MLKRLALLLPLALLTACPPPGGGDYANLEVGYTWEYFLIEGGEEDEFWTLQALESDENPANGRGDIYFRLTRTIPDGLSPGNDQTLEQRRFNVELKQDLTGSAPVDIGWEYKWVLQEEGERGEFLIKTPGSAGDWTDGWDYEITETGSDFVHSIEMRRCDEEVETSYDVFDDCVHVTRTLDTINYDINNNPEDPLTTIHEEVWAEGVGLVRYSILASDGQRSTAVLRTTNSVDEEE